MFGKKSDLEIRVEYISGEFYSLYQRYQVLNCKYDGLLKYLGLEQVDIPATSEIRPKSEPNPLCNPALGATSAGVTGKKR